MLESRCSQLAGVSGATESRADSWAGLLISWRRRTGEDRVTWVWKCCGEPRAGFVSTVRRPSASNSESFASDPSSGPCANPSKSFDAASPSTTPTVLYLQTIPPRVTSKVRGNSVSQAAVKARTWEAAPATIDRCQTARPTGAPTTRCRANLWVSAAWTVLVGHTVSVAPASWLCADPGAALSTRLPA